MLACSQLFSEGKHPCHLLFASPVHFARTCFLMSPSVTPPLSACPACNVGLVNFSTKENMHHPLMEPLLVLIATLKG